MKSIKIRKSNIELVCILSMFMIVLFHSVYKGNLQIGGGIVGNILIDIINHFGELGVNLFILISGYFYFNAKFKFYKIFSLILQINFYTIITSIIFCIITKSNFQIDQVLFPVIRNKYWFATAYILLYIFMPYIKILIDNISKTKFKMLIVILMIIRSIIPTIFGIKSGNTENYLYYNRYIWFYTIYFLGAYISKFLNCNLKKQFSH